MKRLILVAMLCMATLSFQSCSGTIIDPDVICDYADTICQSLNFICSFQEAGTLSKGDADSLLLYLQEVDQKLKEYKAKAIGN